MANKTVRMSQSEMDLLQRKAAEMGCTSSEVIRRALRSYIAPQSDAVHDNGDTELVQVLKSQVETLTWQLSQSQRMLAEQQRLVDQSQQLQLLTMQALPSAADAEGKKKKRKKKQK